MPTRRQVNPLVTKPEPVKKAAAKKVAAPVKKAQSMPPTNPPTNQPESANGNGGNRKPKSVGRIGNVGSIQDLAYSPNGKAWIRFSLAHTPYNPQTKQQEEAIWYSCICFGTLAENVAASIGTGARVIAVGRPQISVWTDDEGTEHEDKQILCDGVGPDLTFATASVTKTFRAKASDVGNEPKFFSEEDF